MRPGPPHVHTWTAMGACAVQPTRDSLSLPKLRVREIPNASMITFVMAASSQATHCWIAQGAKRNLPNLTRQLTRLNNLGLPPLSRLGISLCCVWSLTECLVTFISFCFACFGFFVVFFFLACSCVSLLACLCEVWPAIV